MAGLMNGGLKYRLGEERSFRVAFAGPFWKACKKRIKGSE
jgi:hypothetical protein